ncbi:hypothetical protein BrL25_14215 [Brevibacillus laterosporus DSM 25]|nr:hypothetical protein BrL25_14215 [Brevibacillus laterosporus DSM 25]
MIEDLVVFLFFLSCYLMLGCMVLIPASLLPDFKFSFKEKVVLLIGWLPILIYLIHISENQEG